jgi:hypothetical protein
LKRLHFFTRTLRFFYDLLTYEDIRLLLRRDRRTLFNLSRLKRDKRRLNENILKKRLSFFTNGKKVLSVSRHKFKTGQKVG